MHTRIRISTRLSLIIMIWTFMICGASWQHYGEWVDVTNDPQLVNAAKQAAIEEKRPLLVLYSKAGSDCSHCRALWQGALCDGGDKCIGSSCPLAGNGHPWADYAQSKKIILLYINPSQKEEWMMYCMYQHRLEYSGGYPVYALFHVKDTADCTTTAISKILDKSNVDCIGASYYALGVSINGVKLENTFESFKNLFESYFAEGKETYGLMLEPDSGEPVSTAVVTAKFGASDYTVEAEANAIDIPVILKKKGYLAGAIHVGIKLDDSSFGKGVIMLKGGKTETTLTWTAAENPGQGEPSPKTVAVYLRGAEKDKYWRNGISERTVTLSFVEGGMAEPADENATVTIHIIRKPAGGDNPYSYAGNRFSGTLLDEDEPIGVVDVMVEEAGDGLQVKTIVHTTVTVDGKAKTVEAELCSNEWESIDDDGFATAVMETDLHLDGMTEAVHLEMTVKIDTAGYSLEESQLVIKRTTTNVEVARYDMDFYRNARLEEIQALSADYTMALNPRETEGVSGHGGMIFTIDAAACQATYRGFLPDGKSEFEGVAALRHVFDLEIGTNIEMEYCEFTVFARAHSGEIWKDEWIGGVVRIDMDASEKRSICVQCRPLWNYRSDDDEYDKYDDTAVWRRAGGKRHFSFSGSKFQMGKSLSEQLSGSKQYVNLYYLIVENPPKIPGGTEALLTPKGCRMVENGRAFASETSIFGVALDFGVVDGGGELDGTFSGSMKIYSRAFSNTSFTQEVAVRGVLIGANTDCCSTYNYPVGCGYFMLEGQDRRLYSYDVKILWGGALLLDDEILEWLDNTIRSPMPPLDIVRYGDLEVSGDELDEKFLSAGEDAMVFDGVRETVAVDGDGTAVWLGSSSSVALPAGEWEIHRVDMSGAYRESEPLKLRLTDSVACRLDIRPGWNLLAIPWAMQELAWNQEQLLREQCNGQLFTVEGNSYVAYDGPLAAGCAYWVHAEKKGVITLYGTMDDVDLDDRINMGLPEGDTWYFGTDPGADWRTDGLVWNGRRFVPAKATTDGLAGWWYIRR